MGLLFIIKMIKTLEIIKKGIWSKQISFSVNKKSSADWILPKNKIIFRMVLKCKLNHHS